MKLQVLCLAILFCVQESWESPLPQDGVVLLPATSVEQVPIQDGLIPVLDCTTLFRSSLPECQNVWGEIVVEVSSPLLLVTDPKDRIEKRNKKFGKPGP